MSICDIEFEKVVKRYFEIINSNIDAIEKKDSLIQLYKDFLKCYSPYYLP